MNLISKALRYDQIWHINRQQTVQSLILNMDPQRILIFSVKQSLTVEPALCTVVNIDGAEFIMCTLVHLPTHGRYYDASTRGIADCQRIEINNSRTPLTGTLRIRRNMWVYVT